MSAKISENERAFARIIYSRDSFIEREVIRAYKKERGTVMIDFSSTVSKRLDFLVEAGAIRLWGRRYIVRAKGVPMPSLCSSCID